VTSAGTAAFLELYDRALPEVYGYLSRRCDSAATAEDLTAETFLAAVAALDARPVSDGLSVGWLIGTARHKLFDHWRRAGRQRDALADLWDDLVEPDHADEPLEVTAAHLTLAELAPMYRVALTLRYLDGMAVPDVAAELGRSVHATESLLARARTAFRHTHRSLAEREAW
jgi:RNA polymerase sigma-70 factor (ECF subfamily)